MESRMHGNTHVRFGERDKENHHAETWNGVLSLLYEIVNPVEKIAP